MDEEVPPLEDVPDVLEKLKKINIAKSSSQINETNYAKINNVIDKKEVGHLKKEEEFGGMKKGFLFGSTQKEKNKNAENLKLTGKKKVDIPFIKAASTNSSLVLKEVQEAMSKDAYKEPLNDFSKQVASHPTVSHVLSDPQWIEILDEFQKDPEKAMVKYNDNPKVRSTMQELCSILGDSFLHMSGPPKNEEEALSKILLEDPKLKDALTDPFIEKIMEHMKCKQNDKVHRLLECASSSQKAKLQMLINYGLFSLS